MLRQKLFECLNKTHGIFKNERKKKLIVLSGQHLKGKLEKIIKL